MFGFRRIKGGVVSFMCNLACSYDLGVWNLSVYSMHETYGASLMFVDLFLLAQNPHLRLARVRMAWQF